MPLHLEFPNFPGIVWELDFWVPPVTYYEKCPRKKTMREKISEIVANARARFTKRGHTYEPAKNKAEKMAIRNAFYEALRRENISIDSFPWTHPVAMIVMGFWDKKVRFRWWPGRPFVFGPDVTNMAKQIEDALAPDIKSEWPFPGAYTNDSYIVLNVCMKDWGERSGTGVRLLFLEGEMQDPAVRAGPKRRAKKDLSFDAEAQPPEEIAPPALPPVPEPGPRTWGYRPELPELPSLDLPESLNAVVYPIPGVIYNQ